MGHRNARLTFHGRRLLVQRVRDEQGCRSLMSPRRWGSPASARTAGWPASTPRATPAWMTGRRGRTGCRPGPAAEVEAQVLAARREHRRGQDWLGPELGVPARTVSRILRRHEVPRLCELRPADRRGHPGLEDHRGPLRTGPARRAGPHGRQEDRADPRRRRLARPRPRRWASTAAQKKARIGFDYVHSVVDDHSRFAYSEILPDETGRHLRRVLRPRRRALRRRTASTASTRS